MRLIYRLAILLFLLMSMDTELFAKSPDGDVVSLRNGDIYNGILHESTLMLQTGFGVVRLPLSRIQNLSRHQDRDKISTVFGDIYQGKLQDQELIVDRTLDPTLPLKLSTVKQIDFARRQRAASVSGVPDTLRMRDGSLFLGQILTREILVKSEHSMKMIKLDDLYLSDIKTEEKHLWVRLIFDTGKTQMGELLTTQFSVMDRYGNQLMVPAREINSLAFSVNHQVESRPRYNYRKKVNAGSWFRDRLRDGSMGPEMVALRGTIFQRGDLQGDGDSDESPPQEIHLRPFAVGVYEVTFEEFDRFCESANHEKPDDAGWGRGRRPVVNVSWESARKYVDWLSDQTGYRYRLPTDAEWEYATRAHASTRYWWGDTIEEDRANCDGCGSLWGGDRSSPVGRFDPNPFGLHDTAGNVFEWVEDCWNDNFSDAPADGSALLKADCGVRVIRGGSWSFPPKEVRSANRWRDFQRRSSDDTGFRVVRDLK